MNAKLFFLLGLAVLVARASASGFDFQDDFDKCVEEADDTVEGSSDNGGNCTLYNAFDKMKTNVTSGCDGSSQTAYTSFLAEIQVTLSASGSNSEKYISVSASLDIFAEQYPTCFSVIESINITTIANVKMMRKIVLTKQQKTIAATIELDSSNNCALFDALNSAAAATGDPATVTAVTTLIQTELITICEDSSLNVTEKIAEINAKIQELLTSHAQLQVTIKTTQITSFGFFPQFFQCAVVYKQRSEIELLFEGTYPNILIMTYLQAKFNSLSTIDKISFNIFFSKVKVVLQNTSLTIEEYQIALANIAEEFASVKYAFAYKNVFSISCGDFGTFWDFCFLSMCGEPDENSSSSSSSGSSESSEGSSTLLPSTFPACSCTCGPLDD